MDSEWLVGFLLFAIAPIPFAMLSLALAGQSLIMPLTGVSVVLNQVLAPYVLGERCDFRLPFVRVPTGFQLLFD